MKEQRESDQLLSKVKKIHMVGIGGSGMCPLAEILLKKGYLLTGSDNNESDTLARIRSMGISVTMGHFPGNVDGSELVVYSAAIMKDNPELVSAREKNIPCMERSVLLGAITRKYDNVIGVCGTHGKTTTSSMLTQILLMAGKDPSAVIGGKLPLINANGRAGESNTIVCESCEFVDTFLQMSPDVAVILNIDADHLDYFKTIENLIASFRKFAGMASRVIYNGDDARTLCAVDGLSQPMITFGFEEQNDYTAANIRKNDRGCYTFDLIYQGERLTEITLGVPGRHNILNALAASAAAIGCGVTPEEITQGLRAFGGAGRRFEILAELGGVTVADDYAHHPAELRVTLQTAKEMHFKRVWAVFQPFTFSRTSMLLHEFADVLGIADRVVLTEIMGSREINTYGIQTSDLAALIPGSVWFPEFHQVAHYVCENAKPGDLVITLGCGDVYKVAKLIIKEWEAKGK